MSDEKNNEQAESNLQNDQVHEDAQITQEDLNSSSAQVEDEVQTQSEYENSSDKLPFEYQENKIANFLAVLAAFLFVLGLGFLVYKQFINTKMALSDNFKAEITEEAASSVREENKETVAGTNSRIDEITKSIKDKLSGDDKTEEDSQVKTQKETQKPRVDTIKKAQENTGNVLAGEWKANDYQKGQINKGSYTVKAGDTLWEIAEAVYGDGSQWVNILSANSASVDYLPSGQQSLIYSGQVLVIP
jgi:hypothetical protein